MAKAKPKPKSKAGAATVARRAKIGLEKNKKFKVKNSVTFRVFGDSIGSANPTNKSVFLTANRHFWTVTNVVDRGADSIEITAIPHKVRKRKKTWDTDDDLTVTITLDEGLSSEEMLDCTFDDVEYEDP